MEIQQQFVNSPLPSFRSEHPRVSTPGSLSLEDFDLFSAVSSSYNHYNYLSVEEDSQRRSIFVYFFASFSDNASFLQISFAKPKAVK